jgi:hypothetical protein
MTLMSVTESKISDVDNARATRLARARGYPYEFPKQSFTYRNGIAAPFVSEMIQGRTPVLAFGSNQSPERLQQKFGHNSDTVIPVQRARLRDFDVVYAARITSYGAVPAMLQSHPGANVSLAVTWLDDIQLAVMHESEGVGSGYDFALLDGVDLELDTGELRSEVHLYASLHGHFIHDQTAVALAAVSAKGRGWPARTTDEMLVLARDRVSPETPIDDFIVRLVGDDAFRRACTEVLGHDAVRFSHPHQVIDV